MWIGTFPTVNGERVVGAGGLTSVMGGTAGRGGGGELKGERGALAPWCGAGGAGALAGGGANGNTGAGGGSLVSCSGGRTGPPMGAVGSTVEVACSRAVRFSSRSRALTDE